MTLTDAQRGALHLIRSAGGMTYKPGEGTYFAGDVQIPLSVARALIRNGYLALDHERNHRERVLHPDARRWHYKATGKEIDESEAE